MNVTEANASAAAMIGVFSGLGSEVPRNAGSYRRVRILLRESCCVGGARHPACCSLSTTNLASRIGNASAARDRRDRRGLRHGGGRADFPAGRRRDLGQRPAPPRRAVRQLRSISVLTGGAGAPGTDGWLTIVHVGNAGICRHDCIEVDELHHPIHIRERRGSCRTARGQAEFRGAPRRRVELGPIEGCEMRIFYTADGMINVARARAAGSPAGASRRSSASARGELVPQPSCCGVPLAPGERSSRSRRVAAAMVSPLCAIRRGSRMTWRRAGSAATRAEAGLWRGPRRSWRGRRHCDGAAPDGFGRGA